MPALSKAASNEKEQPIRNDTKSSRHNPVISVVSSTLRPAWKPLYARTSERMMSWSKFISEAYWNVPLES